jgi:hypothetical protein
MKRLIQLLSGDRSGAAPVGLGAKLSCGAGRVARKISS